jgi:hypothetical protein
MAKEVDDWVVVVIIILAALLVANIFVSGSIFRSISAASDVSLSPGAGIGFYRAIQRSNPPDIQRIEPLNSCGSCSDDFPGYPTGEMWGSCSTAIVGGDCQSDDGTVGTCEIWNPEDTYCGPTGEPQDGYRCVCAFDGY